RINQVDGSEPWSRIRGVTGGKMNGGRRSSRPDSASRRAGRGIGGSDSGWGGDERKAGGLDAPGRRVLEIGSRYSVGVGGEDRTALGGHEAAEGDVVDAVLEEADAAVAEQGIDPAGVVGEELVVGAGVVPGGGAGDGILGRLVHRAELVVRGPGDAV